METPSSMRRVTRSQTLAALNGGGSPSLSKTIEDLESRQKSGKQNQDRSALLDITNDSPIVGLAMGNLKTPSSAIAKQRSSRAKKTPGSGEALLRGQVRTLLQKVEEEAELSKLAPETRPVLRLHLQGFVNSPAGLLAPTPANTPFVPNLSLDGNGDNVSLPSPAPSPMVEEQLVSKVVTDISDGNKQESGSPDKTVITRSLFSDFFDKSEISDSSECSSVLTYQGGARQSECNDKSSPDDDDASVWSIQVNASAADEDEEEFYDEEDNEVEDDDNDSTIDELCKEITNISMNDDAKTTKAKFQGKHIRFVYNSDDEIVDEEEVQGCCGGASDSSSSSPNMAPLKMKGLPTPKGKHLRFPQEEEDS